MEYLSALKKSVVAGLMIGIGCTVFLNMDNSICLLYTSDAADD